MTNVRYCDIDEAIEEAAASEEFFDEIELSGGIIGDDVILTYGDTYRVVDKNLIFVEGTYCYLDEDTGELSPDFSVTVLYPNVPDDEFKLDDVDSILCFEQDNPATAIHNYLTYVAAVGERSDLTDEEKISYLRSPYADALCG